jgi:hypothetical protein
MIAHLDQFEHPFARLKATCKDKIAMLRHCCARRQRHIRVGDNLNGIGTLRHLSGNLARKEGAR